MNDPIKNNTAKQIAELEDDLKVQEARVKNAVYDLDMMAARDAVIAEDKMKRRLARLKKKQENA